MGPGGTIVDDKLRPEAEIARHASELKGAEEEEVAAVEEELKPTPPRKLFSKVDDAVKAEEIRVGHVGWGPCEFPWILSIFFLSVDHGCTRSDVAVWKHVQESRLVLARFDCCSFIFWLGREHAGE